MGAHVFATILRKQLFHKMNINVTTLHAVHVHLVCCTSTPVRCAPLLAMLLNVVLFYAVVCCGVIEVDSSPLFRAITSLMRIPPLLYWVGPTRGGMR